MNKITEEEKQGISNGVKISIAIAAFLLTLAGLVWNGAFYVFRFEASEKIQLDQIEQISYLQSQIQALNVKLSKSCNK